MKVALVTGAGSGIGRAIARRLDALGLRLALVGRRRGPLEETARLLGHPASIHTADVSRPAECAATVDAVLAAAGRLDVLVNNAGDAEARPLAESDTDALRSALDVHVLGPTALAQRAWAALRQAAPGRVIAVSSIQAHEPTVGMSAYAASKAALESLARSIEVEGAGAVESYTVVPGAVETPLTRRLCSAEDLPPHKALDPDRVAEVVAACATGRRTDDRGGLIFVRSPA